MKKLLILVTSLAIGTAAFAATPVRAKLNGTIETYDASTRMLTVKHSGKDSTFHLAEQSEVMQGKTKTDPTALAAGQGVSVEYIMNGATKEAEKVELSGAKATAKK
jgi:hypothetical protein